jgi:transposase
LHGRLWPYDEHGRVNVRHDTVGQPSAPVVSPLARPEDEHVMATLLELFDQGLQWRTVPEDRGDGHRCRNTSDRRALQRHGVPLQRATDVKRDGDRLGRPAVQADGRDGGEDRQPPTVLLGQRDRLGQRTIGGM